MSVIPGNYNTFVFMFCNNINCQVYKLTDEPLSLYDID